MTYDDVADVESTTDEAFYQLDLETRPRNWPDPERREPSNATIWRRRMHHLITYDGPGCWVAVDDAGTVVGVVAALKREGMWGLSTYAVRPGIQAKGIGKALLDAALTYADTEGPGFICSSQDPKAIRRYARAGFCVHPAMLLYGVPRRDALPAANGTREGDDDDIELMDRADRAARGAGHGVDHGFLLEHYRSVVVDEGDRCGYAFLRPSGAPYQLAATDDEVASRLLWETFAATSQDTPIDFGHLTGASAWAIDAGTTAGMEIYTHGFVALRRMSPPSAYIPSGGFL